MNFKRVAILASGEGSNAENLMENYKDNDKLRFVCVVTDRPNAGVISKAKARDLPIHIIPYQKNDDKDELIKKSSHEKKILEVLFDYKVEWVCLAGYMRLLGPDFLRAFWDERMKVHRILNIHPSLLPRYPGLDAYQRAYNDGVCEHGVTIHYVDAGMDTGRIVMQESFFRLEEEDFESFTARGKALEHKLYPQVLKKIIIEQQED